VAALVRQGVDVHAFNQRTVAEIFDMIRMLGAMVGAADRADRLADETCMGLFLSSGCFWVLLPVLCSERERPFFIPSPAIRFAERAEGVKGPKR
jgi:hypothetical protein